MGWVLGVDVGGTFTDVFCLHKETGATRVLKVPSTPQDQSQGLLHGLRLSGIEPAEAELIIHGTTVATNAVIQRRGARCGLITTEGFRDVLEMRRRDRPHTYGLTGDFEPLIPRHLRLEAAERTLASGEILKPLDRETVRQAARALLDDDVEAVVVSFLHSYANAENEQLARKELEEIWPNPYIVVASEVLAEYREFERTSTAVVNAYVQPLISRYLTKVLDQLEAHAYRCPFLLIQSNGGSLSPQNACTFAVNSLLSGPAAGVMAAVHVAGTDGFHNVLSCDMGGTSLDVAVIRDGRPMLTNEKQIEFGIPLRVPMIDIHTVGAGGGSIAWIDRSGMLQIGPASVGADPGPVCYGKGGVEPTVTDANLILGRINPQAPIAEDAPVFDTQAARDAIARRIGEPLGLSVEEAAWAIIQVTNNKIAGNIRLVTVERGHDPRDFVLVGFGGAGPLHAAAIFTELGVPHALIPPYPGVTSALGCLVADLRYDFVRTINRRLDELDANESEAVFAGHVSQGEELLGRDGGQHVNVDMLFEADMCYAGQFHSVSVPLAEAASQPGEFRRAFDSVYKEKYGRLLDNIPVMVMSLRTTLIGRRPTVELALLPGDGDGAPDPKPISERDVYVAGGFTRCPVYARGELRAGARLKGPAVIEQRDTTIMIEADIFATVQPSGSLLLEKETD